jgi:ketosteroid isomerase-like protein
MSRENVETVQRAREAWNADDLDAFLAELDPEVEWHPSIERALEGRGTTYRGHDGARKAWEEYRGEAWGRLTAQVQEIRDLGESVLVLGHFDVSGRATGLEFSEELGMLLTFRGGKIVASRDFLSHAEALEAAGLSESATPEDVERLREAYLAGKADDFEPGLAMLAEDVQVQRAAGLGTIRGKEAVREFLAPDAFEYQHLEPTGFRLRGDKIFVSLITRARGRGSGIEVTDRAYTVYTMRNGKVIRVEIYFDEASALEAAGLGE